MGWDPLLESEIPYLLPSVSLSLLLAGCSGNGSTPGDSLSVLTSDPLYWADAAPLGGRPLALTSGESELLVSMGEALWRSPDGQSWLEADESGLAPGPIRFLATIPDDTEVRLAFVHGQGLYRDAGDGWQPVSQPPSSLLVSNLNPRAILVPTDLAADPATPGGAWLTVAGGLFHTDDGGDSWQEATGLSGAGYNLLFTSVDARGHDVMAVAMRPAGVLPPSYSGLLTAHVFRSSDGGETWWDGDPDISFRYPTGVALDPTGDAWVSTQDGGGLFHETDDGWESVGGPSDGLDVAWSRGGLNVASGRQGVWRYQASGWSNAGDGPVATLSADHALGWDGDHWLIAEGAGDLPDTPGAATVYVALSMHVNLYHSYRGDSDTDDGFGQDLDVMRRTLEWLDERPTVHADWDFDNYWSTDTWMQEYGADVLAGVQSRVAADADDVRLMSWNNGAMASHSRAEFDESISRAWDSNLALFDRVVPGVQPQECMFTPEHIGWYVDQGVDWITLFNSGSGFTALRQELDLPEEGWTNPTTITWDGDSLTLVPVYHHADLLNHGGLEGWVQQLHEAQSDDQLLVIHFDADSESWESFDQELDALADLDFVEFTTIQTYLDDHSPTATLASPYDMADGTGDGFQSWAEKDFNHEIATGIAQARELAAQALVLGGGDEAVTAQLDAAVEPRLLALSTTNFGLAAPTLHEDRVASARDYVEQSMDGAQQALDLAEALEPVEAGTIRVTEYRGSSGAALVQASLQVDSTAWSDPDNLVIRDEDGQELPLRVVAVQSEDAHDLTVEVELELVLQLEAGQQRTLSWTVEPDHEPTLGQADLAALDAALPLATPLTECDGSQTLASSQGSDHGQVDDRQLRAERTEQWALGACGEEGSLAHTLVAYDGLPGLVLEVDGTLPALDEDTALLLESVALSPLACDGAADSLTWRTMGGAELTRPVRQAQETWNGQAVDGWLSIACADGAQIQVSHRVLERTSLALGPMRTLTGQDAIFAPLGTLWGDAPMHDVRRTGGHGMGDIITEIIGSQFRPAAPDWAGQTVRYRLLLGDGTVDSGTLDLFAHPPLVQVGAYAG